MPRKAWPAGSPMPYASVSTMRPPATPCASTRTSNLPIRNRASRTVSTGISALSSTRGRAIGGSLLSHAFDQMGARRSRLEGVTEVLCLAGDLAIQKLHDAHRIGRLAIIGEDEFRNPEIAAADNAAHTEALRVRLCGTRGLDVVPPPDAFARLRVLEHGILSVYVVFTLKIICIGRGPMVVQRLADRVLTHGGAPLSRLLFGEKSQPLR